MKLKKTFARLAVALALLVASFAIPPNRAQAQAQGNKTVYNSTSNPAPSQVWIDASAFCGTSCTGSDFCQVLNQALQQVPAQGAVVDARGIVPSSGGSLTCNGNPWDYSNIQITRPSTVLLPAATINISSPWVCG
jgi:hypothetical protein